MCGLTNNDLHQPGKICNISENPQDKEVVVTEH